MDLMVPVKTIWIMPIKKVDKYYTVRIATGLFANWKIGKVNTMNNLNAKIHDACLDHESEIWELVEQLGDRRNKNYETGRIEDIDLMIPILNGIEYEVERYKEYIREIKNE